MNTTTLAIHPVPGTGYRLRLEGAADESGEVCLYVGTVFIGQNARETFQHEDETTVRAWLNQQWTTIRDARGTVIEPDRFYVIGEGSTMTVYRTVLSASGHPYAKRLDGASWTYAPGAILDIREHGRRMTVEEAAEVSRTLTFCIRCGRHLTHPESVSAGIGPICSGKI